MSNWFTALLSQIEMLFKSSEVKPGVTLQQSIANILLANTCDFHSPRTGGTLHKIDSDTAMKEAALIVKYAPIYHLDPLLVVAGIIGESRGDPGAINPNFQKSVIGETQHQTFLHTDLGPCQFDVATFINSVDFVDMTDVQIQAKMCSLDWAIPEYCKFLENLVERSQEALKANPNLLGLIPHRDQSLLAEEAYNTGLHGAEIEAAAHGAFKYSEAWQARYLSYKKMVGATT